MFKILLFLLAWSVKSAFCANILFVSSVPSPSHHIWNKALAFQLAARGHNVTLIGPDKDKVVPANYTHIYLEGLYDDLHDSFDINEMASNGPRQMMAEFVNWCLFSCGKTLKTQGLQQLLNYPPDFKFDLLIFDVTAGSCLYPLIQRFNFAPSIAVTAFLLPPYVSYNFGNQLYPAYIPWYGLPYSTDMSFIERVWNFIFTYYDLVYRNLRLSKEEHALAKEVFGQDISSMQELERHISLVLANTDPLLDHPQPLTPNIIPVGGLHTRKPKSVTQDLQTLLDNAKNGVILFSLGTNIRSDKLDKSIQKALLDAFRKIKQTVIWKFESEISDLPKNVVVRKWLPQNDILGHPNVKLFIGHGGALSTQEALYHGVPMICIPFIVDQYINTRIIVNKKLGVSIDFKRITTGYVLQKLREVLDNPMYSENMQKISSTYRDRAETPLERGVFWVEYVIRHGGAYFLETPARDFPFYKSSGLDVILFLVALGATLVFVSCKLIKFILRKIVGREKVKIN